LHKYFTMRNIYTYTLLAAITLGAYACVPARKLQEKEAELAKCKEESAASKTRLDELEKTSKDMQKELDDNKVRLKALMRDTTIMGNSNRILTSEYDKIAELNREIQRQLEMLRKGSEDDSRNLTVKLEQTRKELMLKEESLKMLEKELDLKKRDLEDREKRIKELEELIAKKDKAVADLQKLVEDALLSFKDKGLTVVTKNGKVYVSMEAKLLFASGKYSVDNEGKEAVIKLAKILESQKDLEVLVEGHTDTDALKSPNVPTDNWELSVLRSTSVVKLMLKESKMEPKKVTAAGRSEFLPVDAADKAKNRRIEIILIPNLDELYKLIEKK
jgi:chemotaxis protein MotB